MKINSEWKLLDAIRDKVEREGVKNSSDLAVSIGDDCAVFDLDDDSYSLLTTDISIESVHFRRDLVSLEDVGFKAMMGNISDIAAMGGWPCYAIVSLGIPAGTPQEDVLSIYDGFLQAANMAGVAIAGGDLSKSGELAINIALYGRVNKARLVKREGARPGDIIYVTGNLGDSMAGLEILLSRDDMRKKRFPGLIQRHKRPLARFDAVNDIVNLFNPTSMLDISDGLLSDLRHICNAVSLGFRLHEDRLPISGELMEYSSTGDKTPQQYALTSGEEYELLFTSNKSLAELMRMSINDVPVTPIGEMTNNGFYIVRNDKQEEIPISGFNHFEDGI